MEWIMHCGDVCAPIAVPAIPHLLQGQLLGEGLSYSVWPKGLHLQMEISALLLEMNISVPEFF